MILYLTKQTIDRFKVKLPNELSEDLRGITNVVMEKEQGDSLLEWGGKLFYFDRSKCLQVVNFASKFTLFLVDIKKDMFSDIPNYMANYLFDIFHDDKEMTSALEKMFQGSPIAYFGRLTDKSAIATLNTTQRTFLDDGNYLYDFIQDGILHTREVNYKVNFKYLTTVNVDGKKDYHYPGEVFRDIVLKRYGESPKPHFRIVN